MMRLAKLGIAAALLAGAAPVMAAPEPAKPGLQAQFDAATEAKNMGDCRTALPMFEALAANPAVKPGTVPAAMIALRRGVCMVRLGDETAGEALIAQGLPVLQQAGGSLAEEAAGAELTLGDLAFTRWDHDAAVRHDKAALAMLTGDGRIAALVALAKVTAFDGGPEPLAYADEALAIAQVMPKPDKAFLAALRSVRARTLLNQGQAKEGYAELRKALDLAGGLTLKISLSEAVMRSDLAQAALLVGDQEAARKYLAYTGAGRISEAEFSAAEWSELPQCGPETGLAPDDAAIVEFALGADGHVVGAQTVYSRTDFAKASAFARAVSQWNWRPETLAKIPGFYKAMSRIELRCSLSGGGRAGVTGPIAERFVGWALARLAGSGVGEDQDRKLRRRTLVALADQPGDAQRAIAAAGLLALNGPGLDSEVGPRVDRALGQAAAAKIPAEQVSFLRIAHARFALEEQLRARKAYGSDARAAWQTTFGDLARAPDIAADPLAQDTSLMLAVSRARLADAAPTLRQVANDARLAERHPLRQAAWLRLSDLAASQKDYDGARAAFEKTGLTEQQCAAIGAEPERKGGNNFDGFFPREAFGWGFEGWVKMEFDVEADGATARQRAVAAYPPFVFVDAAGKIAKAVRYQASYRPSNGTACSAKVELIKFNNELAH